MLYILSSCSSRVVVVVVVVADNANCSEKNTYIDEEKEGMGGRGRRTGCTPPLYPPLNLHVEF